MIMRRRVRWRGSTMMCWRRAVVKYLVVLESINDIHYATMPRTPEDVVTAEQLIWGLQQIVLRAHAHGIKVYGATLTPFGGSRAENAAGEVMRSKINAWIRTSGVFDAVIDFDAVVRDPRAYGAVLAGE